MRNIWLIAQNTINVLFKRKINIFTYIALPIIATFLVIMVFGGGDQSVLTMGIVNEDNSELSIDMIEYLENTERFKKKEIDIEEIEDQVVNGNVAFVLSINEDFEESILNGKETKVEIISIKGKDTTVWVENYVDYYIKNLKDIAVASKDNKDDFYEIYENQKYGSLKFNVEKLKDQYTGKTVGRQGIGFFIMFLLIGAANTSNLILKERRERTFHRICTAPVNSREYVFGNVLASLFIITIQIIAIIVLVNLIGLNMYIDNLDLFVVLFVFGLCAIGLGMIIVTFSKSSSESSNLSTLLIVPTCMLGGCFWQLEIMPQNIQRIADLVPQKWAIDAIYKLQRGYTLFDIRFNLILLGLFALVFFSISAVKMKNSNKTGKFI